MDLKVISGDNPFTVSNIARRAGLPNYDAYVDLLKLLKKWKCEKLLIAIRFWTSESAAKKLLVNELKESGRTVAMTGDGE